MRRVLVTGARGFIGRHTLRFLNERGFEVVAVASNAGSPRDPEVEWRTADLLDLTQIEQLVDDVRATHLLHLAWYAKPGAFWNAPENLRWVRASQELLQCFQSCGGERTVVAGTCAEYAEISGTYHEDGTPTEPRTVYGKCKHALRLYLDCLSEITGLSSAWGRIFFLYGADGPAEKFPQAVVHSLSQGHPARCSHGRQRRDFLDVRDVASALVALLDSPVTGAVNIGGGRGLRLAEMAEHVAARYGRLDLLQLGALPTRPTEPAEMVADIARLRDEVGWNPQIGIGRGLDELVDSWSRSTAHEDAA